MAGWLPGLADQIDGADYRADDSTIDTHAAVIAHLIEECRSLGVNSELPRLAKTLTDWVMAQRRGGDSYAAMVEQFRKPPATGRTHLVGGGRS